MGEDLVFVLVAWLNKGLVAEKELSPLVVPNTCMYLYLVEISFVRPQITSTDEGDGERKYRRNFVQLDTRTFEIMCLPHQVLLLRLSQSGRAAHWTIEDSALPEHWHLAGWKHDSRDSSSNFIIDYGLGRTIQHGDLT
jgi:hypothetical protein